MRLFKRKRKTEEVFTGNCLVRQHTADGVFVGRCYHSTYDKRCPLHGDVSEWLKPEADFYDTWPKDYEL